MEVEVPPTVVEPVKVKRPVSEAKRKQLESAREKKATLKKVIEPESDSSDDETEPVKKKSKVITKSNSGGNDMEQWGTTAIRTAALVSLAGATFYMQNIYGKKKTSPSLCHRSRKSRRCKLTCFQLVIGRLSAKVVFQFKYV